MIKKTPFLLLALCLACANLLFSQSIEKPPALASPDGRDTLQAPIRVVNFQRTYEIEGGLLLQRNDSLYQTVKVELKANGELHLHVGPYISIKEAEVIILETFRRGGAKTKQ